MAARLDVAMGVAHGVAVAGYVGAESRFEYTVIGDPVNEASRLTELAKRHPGRLLASAEAVRAAGGAEAAAWREDGEVVLRGRRAPTRLAIPVAPPARAARPAAGEPVPAGR
jgi:adenylate cyclase